MGFIVEQPKQRVDRPTSFSGCWVKIRLPVLNRARVFASYYSCSKRARAGKLTCAHHDKWEAEAQSVLSKERR